MADAQASLILTATDVTGAAFASANRNLAALETNAQRTTRTLTGSFSSLRSALAFLGVALSGRMFVSWITNAVRAAEATGANADEVMRAKEALEAMRRASDELAISFGTRLLPALSKVAIGWSRILTGADPFPSEQEIAAAEKRIERLESQLQRGRLLPSQRAELKQEIEQAQARLAQLRRQQEEALGLGLAGARAPVGITFNEEETLVIREREKAIEERLNELARQSIVDREHELELVAAVRAERERVAELEQEAAADLVGAVALERARVAAEEREANDERRAAIFQRFDDLRLEMSSEIDLEIETARQRQEVLDQALAERFILEQEYAARSEALARQTEENITRIRQREMQAQLSARAEMITGVAGLFTALAAISSVSANESKKKFEQDKKIQRAAAIVNTLAGVTQALAAYPPPLSFVWAAAVSALGFAQVRQINATTWQGGEGGGGFGGGFGGAGAAGVPVSEPSSPSLPERDATRGRVMIEISGNHFYGPGGAEEFGALVVDLIKSEVNDRDVVIIDRNSRQGMSLRGEAEMGI